MALFRFTTSQIQIWQIEIETTLMFTIVEFFALSGCNKKERHNANTLLSQFTWRKAATQTSALIKPFTLMELEEAHRLSNAFLRGEEGDTLTAQLLSHMKCGIMHRLLFTISFYLAASSR